MTPKTNPLASLMFGLGLSLFALATGQAAEAGGTGTIEGRILNSRSGEYLEKARVTVEGTSLEAFSDTTGQFRLGAVPAGSARLRVFFTGLDPLTETVNVAAGATVQRDFTLGASRDTGVVRLSEFVVGASREMDGTAIAINEQRFAANISNVVSSDEFGSIVEGNIGEFMKFMPSITVESSGGNARFISINGVPADNVPVTIDGFSLATTGNAGTGRAVDIDMMSINNASRIEVSYSPTPESQGGALAGSVNLVPRSSFERTRPSFRGSVYLMMRDNARDFNEVPGPREGRATRNVHPGFDFVYINPVSRRFGFTLSGGYSTQYSAQDTMQNNWRGVSQATNGAAFPHTTPDRPYLTSYLVRDEPKVTTRRSLGTTVDFRLSPNDRLSLSIQYSSFAVRFLNNAVTFTINRVLPGNFTPTSTQGAPGGGELQLTNSPRHRFNETYMPSLVWRHTGPIYKAEVGLGMSRAFDKNNLKTHEGFNSITARRTGVTVGFDDIFYLRPRRITVTDGTTAQPVDPYRADTYVITASGQSPRTVSDLQRSVYGNVRRDFQGRLPLSLKGGVDVRQSARDFRSITTNYNYVGRDGRASTTPVGNDDGAGPFLDPLFSRRVGPFGFPQIDAVSNKLLWAHYQANPGQFTTNENTTYRSGITNSKFAEETIYASYLRGDLSLLDRRLKLVGGLRAEQTNIDAQGPLSDPTRNFRRDANGRVILGANGQPLPIATDPLGMSRLTFLDRGSIVEKEYLRWFPNLNMSFNLREDVIFRAAYYQSVGRPDFNQYAGGLTLPDLEIGPTPTNRMQVNNAAIKAWTAETVNVRLEYYLPGVGQISVGAFRRDFENFFGGTELIPTPEFLAIYGLDPALYGDYRVATQHNVEGIVRMTGVDLNYKQALTFLPHWARGVQVFANVSAQRATGPTLGAFTGSNYVPRSGSWGVSLTREKFNLRANWNYRGRQRRGEVGAGASIEPGTYNWGTKRLNIDVQGEYHLTRNLAVFANLRNVGNAYDDFEIYGPSTPEHAQFRSRRDYGALWMFGVKGSF
jgi:iron complex outermembrane receptor protein